VLALSRLSGEPSRTVVAKDGSPDNLDYLILPPALGPMVYSASNRNEYYKHKNNNVSE
jgi:hypothetical protein